MPNESRACYPGSPLRVSRETVASPVLFTAGTASTIQFWVPVPFTLYLLLLCGSAIDLIGVSER